MKTKNLFLATIIWSSPSTAATARIIATAHRDNANDISLFQATHAFGVGTETNNSATGFMADRTWSFDPGEIRFAGTGTVIRSADSYENWFDDNLPFDWVWEFDIFDGEIAGNLPTWFARVDVLASVKSKSFYRFSQGVSPTRISKSNAMDSSPTRACPRVITGNVRVLQRGRWQEIYFMDISTGSATQPFPGTTRPRKSNNHKGPSGRHTTLDVPALLA